MSALQAEAKYAAVLCSIKPFVTLIFRCIDLQSNIEAILDIFDLVEVRGSAAGLYKILQYKQRAAE